MGEEEEEILKLQKTRIDLDDYADRRGQLIQNILLIHAKQHGVICKKTGNVQITYNRSAFLPLFLQWKSNRYYTF